MTPSELKTLRAKLKLIPGSDKKSHTELKEIIQAATEQVDDSTVRDTWELFGCFDETEYQAALIVPVKSVVIGHLLSMGRFSATNAAIRKAVLLAFGEGKTMASLRKLSKRLGSMAESIGLSHVTESDVADALLRTAD